MFPEIHRRVKHKAVALSRIEGITQCEAARLCGISERTLRRAKAREIAHGDIDGAKKKRGRKSIWVPAFKDEVLAMVLAVPSATLKEYSNQIYDDFGLRLTDSAICKFLKEEGVSRKKLQNDAKQRNEKLRGAWIDKLGHWKAEQLVFVDESGINPKTGDRVYGYAKKGKAARQRVPGPKSENYSLLPAITIQGYIACNVYQGPVDREMFLDFIQYNVLPHCTKFPGPRSIIIMDNAAIHNKAKELIEAHGMKCEYLPPYSPDFNPIELSFSVLKSALKYHYDTHSTRSPKEFAELIYNAAMEEVTPQVALNQFRHCKIKAGSEWYDNQWI